MTSRLARVPARLEEVAQHALSVGVQIALAVTVGAMYTDLDIGSIRGKPADNDPSVLSDLHQRTVEPTEALTANVDPSVIIRDSMSDSSEGSSDA